MAQKETIISEFINITRDLLLNFKLLTTNSNSRIYINICCSFVNKYPKEYINLYKQYVFKKRNEIKNYDFSIIHFKPVKSLNIYHVNIDNFENIIKSVVSDWEGITQDNKRTIFDYLIIMNEMVEKFDL